MVRVFCKAVCCVTMGNRTGPWGPVDHRARRLTDFPERRTANFKENPQTLSDPHLLNSISFKKCCTALEDLRFNRKILNENNENEKQKHGELLYFFANSFLYHFIYEAEIIISASPDPVFVNSKCQPGMDPCSLLIRQICEFQSVVIELSFNLAF